MSIFILVRKKSYRTSTSSSDFLVLNQIKIVVKEIVTLKRHKIDGTNIRKEGHIDDWGLGNLFLS